MRVHKRIVRRESYPGDLLGEDIHPILARIYAARNLTNIAELDRGLEKLIPYTTLKDVDAAVELLCDAVIHQQNILILADFDVDGATSCTVALRALRMMGAAHASYLVPNRFEYGYGLTPEIAVVASKYKPDLLVTVDNGISSIDGIAVAKSHGMKVLVTDHHLQGARLPDADAIVNPNQKGDEFPSKMLAGVGVIFYVMLALRARLKGSGWFDSNNASIPNLATLLDLVALGTVADVVPLDANNRILVEQGLRRIRAGQCCPGITALLKIARRNPQRLVAADMGFAIAPRLNAAGRLDDMSLGIECLLSNDQTAADQLAAQLDELNQQRRQIESKMQYQAIDIIESLHLDDDNKPPVALCLYDDRWHQGVIGILASRIKERLHRPVIAFARAGRTGGANDANDNGEDSDEIKGSARSIPGLHIRDALDAVASRYPALLNKFGGHAMAAGMTIRAKDLTAFTRAFQEEVSRTIAPESLQGIILSDGELGADELSLVFAEGLRRGGPWGQGFPEPIFDGHFQIVDRRIVGEKHLKMLLRAANSEQCIDAIAFNIVDRDWPRDTREVEIAYRLDVNEYRGVLSPQLIIEQVTPCQE
ncbi:MAG: single-stranded-DNA-specific exonuclease RecJ [Gammaproteobacteria bacterium]|nr:MAG: single-stranded-DNA-specific exonuclease RecJ [Gammaproteobacteria bacterium]